MKELLDKLSSYNVFNFLLPGVIFAVFAGLLTNYNFVHSNVIIGAFIYYFIGLIISRFGSLIIEPILKKIGFVKFVKYKKFKKAAIEDEKLVVFSETNNMFRTFIATFILLLITKYYEYLESLYSIIIDYRYLGLAIVFFIVFLFAYRKQTKYIVERVG